MKIVVTDTFKRNFSTLSDEEAKLVRDKLALLMDDTRYPSLRVKKMKGRARLSGIYRMRVSKSLRVTFTMKGDTIILRKVGGHEETIIHP